jgi:hypothetical protein
VTRPSLYIPVGIRIVQKYAAEIEARYAESR